MPLQKLPCQEIEALQTTDGLGFFAKNALNMLAKGKDAAGASCHSFRLWQFGKDLTLVGYSGESIADYVDLLEQAGGTRWV